MSEEELYRFIQRQERDLRGDDSYFYAGDKKKEEDEIDFYLRKRGRSDKREKCQQI